MLSLVAQNSELDSHAWMVNSMPGGVGNQCNKRNENYCTDHSLNHGPAHFIFWNTLKHTKLPQAWYLCPCGRGNTCGQIMRTYPALTSKEHPFTKEEMHHLYQSSIPKTCRRTWLLLKNLLILPHVRIFLNSAFIFNSSHTRQPIKKITWINTTSLQWI